MAKDTFLINQFERDVNTFIDQIDDSLDDLIYNIGYGVEKALIEVSPVDTGRFRANWQITEGAPATFAINDTDKEGKQTLQREAGELRKILNGGGAVRKLYFSNMLTYANALEYGHSAQAPAGVIGVVEGRLGSIVSAAIQKSKVK